jgi:hypothetical protein
MSFKTAPDILDTRTSLLNNEVLREASLTEKWSKSLDIQELSDNFQYSLCDDRVKINHLIVVSVLAGDGVRGVCRERVVVGDVYKI